MSPYSLGLQNRQRRFYPGVVTDLDNLDNLINDSCPIGLTIIKVMPIFDTQVDFSFDAKFKGAEYEGHDFSALPLFRMTFKIAPLLICKDPIS